jgi:CHAT domain-containing protein
MPMMTVMLAVLVLLSTATAAAAAPDTANALRARGLQMYQRGALDAAAVSWTDAARAYERQRKASELADTLTLLARANQGLGRNQAAIDALERARTVARKSGDRARLVSVLTGLGSVSLAAGRADQAEAYLREAMALTHGDAEQSAVLNELGNLAAVRDRTDEALGAYRESVYHARRAGRRTLAARAATNGARVAQRTGAPREALESLNAAHSDLKGLAQSHEMTQNLIAVGLLYRDLRVALPEMSDRLWLTAGDVFREAGSAADAIGDARMAAYAWGHLGELYEAEGKHFEALRLTRQAIVAAQRTNAPESLYRWQWQSGRLLGAQGRIDDAIGAYRRAVGTLESIRADVAAGSEAPQLSFRQSVGPVYLELVDLLLRRAGSLPEGRARPLLVEARESVELLKVAELRDYFRDDCVDAARARVRQLDVVSHSAVVVYPVLLPDRTELLVTLPAGLKRVTVPVGLTDLTQEVRRFRHALEKRTTREFLPHAQRLYDWLIRPLDDELGHQKTDTLVFVPDGPLRTIPMAALHDGQQFLIARYALATTPGINLTDPRPLARDKIRVLAVGVTEAVHGFPALPFVSAELAAVREVFQGTTLLNEEFRVSALQTRLQRQRFNVLHIASHAQFERDVADTFLLAHDGRLTMNRLDEVVGLFQRRDEPLELLILSACETAAGDDRAALGLAGIAVKAGARSAVATLWFINDQASSELIAQFYRQLRDPAISRAVALQRAQLALLADPRYAHPALWSPFLLINNWL